MSDVMMNSIKSSQFYKWQLSVLSEFMKSEPEVIDDVLLSLYGYGQPYSLVSSKILPDWVNFASPGFRISAAETFLVNLSASSILNPVLSGNEVGISRLLMNMNDESPNLSDLRDGLMSKQDITPDEYMSVYGFHHVSVFSKFKDALVVTSLDRKEVERRLGTNYSGVISADWGELLSRGKYGRVYIDMEYLSIYWNDPSLPIPFEPITKTFIDYHLKNNVSESFPLLAYQDAETVCRFCVYNS